MRLWYNYIIYHLHSLAYTLSCCYIYICICTHIYSLSLKKYVLRSTTTSISVNDQLFLCLKHWKCDRLTILLILPYHNLFNKGRKKKESIVGPLGEALPLDFKLPYTIVQMCPTIVMAVYLLEVLFIYHSSLFSNFHMDIYLQTPWFYCLWKACTS